jgi:drug/metabolite transporter (DMT)-like permease
MAILGGLAAALAWTATTITAARATRIIDSRSLLATVMAVGLVLSLPLALATGIPSLDATSVLWLVVSGTGNVVGLLSSYTALRVGKVGVVAPVVSTEGAVAALIAVVAGETLAPGTGVALGVVAAGVVLAARAPYDPDTRADELRAALFAGGAALSFGCSLYATAQVGKDLGVFWAALPPRAVGVAAIALPLLASRRWRLRREALPWAAASGVGEVFGTVAYAWGARHGLAVTAVLASQFAAISAVVGYVAFRERLARVQVVGVATIVCGVAALALLRS